MSEEKQAANQLPIRSVKYLTFLSFGIFGTQMAFGLESSQLGRLFQTIGAKPELLGIIFIIPSLTGLIAQPLIGKYSDRTWLPSLGGRRMPYLIIGSILTVLSLIILPNSGSFGWPAAMAVSVAAAIVGIFMVASNVCVQPYKMLVGDMVHSRQKGQAYAIQSLLLNAGILIAAVAPFIMTSMGISNTAKPGVVPDTVAYAFYLAAIAISLCSLVTIKNVKEYSPEEFNQYHGNGEQQAAPKNMKKLLTEAPRIFWIMALVQFFAYFAFSYLWVYGAGVMADNIYGTTNPNSVGYQQGGNLFGLMSALYALITVLITIFLSRLAKKYYVKTLAITLMIGGFGFISIFLAHTLFTMTLSFILVGIGWSALTVYPLTFVTDAIPNRYMGTYLGLFNAQLCIPQIAGSLLSVVLLPLLHGSMPRMIFLSGILLILAAFSTLIIKKEDIQ